MRNVLIAGALSGVLVACASGGRGAASSCDPPSGSTGYGGEINQLAGPWVMTLVATSGPRSGARHVASMTLSAGTTGLTGSGAIRADSVGAAWTGDVSSTDPSAPGVVVSDYTGSSGARTVILRFGTVSRQPGIIEGPYFAATIRQSSDSGFRGTWASGDGQNEVAAGHFCARRL